MFGKETVRCPAGQWTTIIRSRFAQMPTFWDVHLRPESGEVVGEFVETKSRWFLPVRAVSGPLRERLTFERGYWNTFYTVRIRPRTPVVAEIE